MMIAVPLELAASSLGNGGNLGSADRSALVIGGTDKIRTGGAVVFCKVVAVAEARVKRDGQVRAKGSPVHHATLGPLEERLGSRAGPGAAAGIAGRAPLGAQVVRIRRDTLDADGAVTAKEIVHAATSLDAVRGTPETLAALARGQWAIEAVHWIRSPGAARAVA